MACMCVDYSFFTSSDPLLSVRLFLSLYVLPEEGEYFLKVLIPSYAAGSIIGKGGQTIVQLQKETGATIKLSKSKDFYPGNWIPLCPWSNYPNIKAYTQVRAPKIIGLSQFKFSTRCYLLVTLEFEFQLGSPMSLIQPSKCTVFLPRQKTYSDATAAFDSGIAFIDTSNCSFNLAVLLAGSWSNFREKSVVPRSTIVLHSATMQRLHLINSPLSCLAAILLQDGESTLSNVEDM